MKKIILTATSLLIFACSVSSANAAVLNFDNITAGNYAELSGAYDTLKWHSGVYEGKGTLYNVVLNKDPFNPFFAGTGINNFQNLVTSGNYAAVTLPYYNMNTPYMVLSGNKSFDFNSANFASLLGINSSINLTITGYKSYSETIGQNQTVQFYAPVGMDTFAVTNIAPFSYFAGNKFLNIDKIVINSSGNNHFVMDDFTYNESVAAPVPEPSSIILGLMSLGSLLGFRKRKVA